MLVSTDRLVNAGVVDAIYGGGDKFMAPTVRNCQISRHVFDPDEPSLTLPEKAVVQCFSVHFKDCLSALSKIPGKFVVIRRDGDPSIPLEGWPDSVKHVFSDNCPVQNERVTPMPQGSYLGGCMEDDGPHIKEALSIPRTSDYRVLCSYSLDMPGSVYGPSHERIQAIEYFKNQPWAFVNPLLLDWQTRTGPITPSWTHPEYLKMLRTVDYLCVPIGYGIDRMAGWEAITLGTIPICKRHSELSHFEDMPIAWVNDWSEVTPDFCDKNKNLIQEKSSERMSLEYWILAIRSKKDLL